jgi:hypothetical protein
MHVSRLQIENLRCFRSARVDFSRTITLLAGENNSGKSTMIQALLMLQANVVGHDSIRIGSTNGSVTIELQEVDPRLFPHPLRPWLRNNKIDPAQVQFQITGDPPGITPMVHGPLPQQHGVAQFHPSPQAQPDNFLVPYLSERRHAGYGEVVGEQHAFSAAGSLHSLAAKVDRCLTGGDDLRNAYRAACQGVLGFFVTAYPSGPAKMAGLEINGLRRQYIPLSRLGSGVGQAVGLIVELLVAERKLFLIEELENDMHPTALRSLLDLIERGASQGNQFIISTHSNVVLRRLGSVPGARVWQTIRVGGQVPPESKVLELPRDEPAARRALLQTLGYDLSDYDLYDAWLFLEEASAEGIIREFIIPWFAPGLAGRLRTLAAGGAPDVGPRFIDLHRLFLFTHLEPVYRERAWVLVDSDDAGKEVVRQLKETFATWPTRHFQCFDQEDFEGYYPRAFEARVQEVLALTDEGVLRQEKARLAKDAVVWLREDEERGKEALAESAKDVIERLRGIERVVTARPEPAGALAASG